MTEQSKNPLMARGGTAPGKAERGSDEALRQLREHCDRLNAMAFTDPWVIIGRSPDRRVGRASERRAASPAA